MVRVILHRRNCTIETGYYDKASWSTQISVFEPEARELSLSAFEERIDIKIVISITMANPTNKSRLQEPTQETVFRKLKKRLLSHNEL